VVLLLPEERWLLTRSVDCSGSYPIAESADVLQSSRKLGDLTGAEEALRESVRFKQEFSPAQDVLDDVLQAERFPAGFCGRELFDLAKGSSERFTGTVRVDALFQAPDPYEADRPSGKERLQGGRLDGACQRRTIPLREMTPLSDCSLISSPKQRDYLPLRLALSGRDCLGAGIQGDPGLGMA
jgi:hypothetical protein